MKRRRFVHDNSPRHIRFRNRFSHSVFDQTRNVDTSREGPYPILTEDNDEIDLDYNNEYDHNVEESNKKSSSSEGSSEESNDGDNDDNGDSNKEEESSSLGGSSEESNDDDDDNDDSNKEEELSSLGGSSEESNDDDDDDDDSNKEEESLDESNGEYENNSIEESSLSSEESSEESEEVDDDDNEGSLSEDDEEHYQIVDEALDETKMPHYNINNEFTSYFENFTTASMFCWLQKHNISTSAYEDLAEILCNPQFNSTHVVKNVRRFRTWRQHLPLLPILARPISITSKKTPSTSKDSKISYQLSISDIIWHVLNNPSLMKHMYFGPGIDSEIKSEYWHGTLWGESPFFGEKEIIIFEVKYRCGDFIHYNDNNKNEFGRLRAILKDDDHNLSRLRIQKALSFQDLPGSLRSKTRRQRSVSGEFWLTDDYKVIATSQIINKSNVKITDIKEIVYEHRSRWHARNIELSYQHPADYITLESPPSPFMPVYKLFIDLYYDDFGTYRNVYHSLGGVYVQFGNMPIHQRKLIKNHFVLGFVPFGGSFNEFLRPFISEMKVLEQGKVMKINGQDAWVVAGLGVITSDLPQGNDMVRTLRHNALKGCRTCTISRELFTDHTQDMQTLLRYHQITDNQFNEIINENNRKKKNRLCTDYGLRPQPNILDELKRERHLQAPQDVYHATAGKIGRLLEYTCEIFSERGENDFIKTWKDFEKLKKWARLPNPISHRKSFMMSDCLRLAMIMPFLLYQFLEVSSIKKNEAKEIQNRMQITRLDLVPKKIISCWVHVAKTMKIVFNSKFTLDGYKELQQCLEEELIILPTVFKGFNNLPNLHINMHLVMHAKTYGTLCNTQVGIKEMVHRIFKGMVPHTNRKNVDFDLLKRYNTLFAIRHLVDGGIDSRFTRNCTGFTNMSSNFKRLFLHWYLTEDNTSKNEQEHDDDSNEITSPKEFISNISLKKQMNKNNRNKLKSTLSDLKKELFLSYNDIGFKSSFIYEWIGYYELASYTIEEENGTFLKVHLHIDDFVTIQEEEYKESYAIVKGILKHKYNNEKYYAFVVVDWFEYSGYDCPLLKCPIYSLQTEKWRRIFPITVLENVQKVHFIRYDNARWIKNNFYFTAI